MKKFKFYILVFICMVLQIKTFAQNEINLDNLYTTLNISLDKVVKELVIVKLFPTDSSSPIIVIPVKNEDEIDDLTADMHLLKINHKTGKILCHNLFDNILLNDAIRLYAIQIDTMLYQIKENENAFAIKLHYTNDSRSAGYIGEELLLFEERDNSFILILRLDNINENIWYGGGDCENTEIYNKKSTFIIDTMSSKNGYFNIIEDIYFEHYYLDKDCEDSKKKNIKNLRNVYEFIDNSYICIGERKTGFK